MVANIRQTDTIATNMERENSGVEYYAFRNITWELSSAEFLESLGDQENAVYLFCPANRDVIETESLAEFDSITVLEYCCLY